MSSGPAIGAEPDPLWRALNAYRRRKFEKASEFCDQILAKNPYDQVYVDEVENDEEGVAETAIDDNTVAQVARPGTSLQKPMTGKGLQSQSYRPRTQTGRPLSGVIRPGTQMGRPGTMEQALRTARTSKTARPVTSSTGRFVRLGTASMLSNPDGPFVNVSRLNFAKYAAQANLGKPLFEYLFYHENDVRSALQLAAQATQSVQFKDWYWKSALGKCYYRLGLYRDAEKQLKSAAAQEPILESFLLLAKVYVRMDQPLTAAETYKHGLEKFPCDTSLLIGLARIYDGLNDLNTAVAYYKEVLKQDSTNIEAIACIGTNHFYNDQPEIALRFYRRLLQMGVYNAEMFTNIGLCCFYAQQYDMALSCLEKAVVMADNESAADIWFNIAHVAIGVGDTSMAFQCLKLAITANNDHAEAYCNLGVLELRKGNLVEAKALFETAMKTGDYTFEPFYNYALLCYKLGDLQQSFNALKKSIELFPEHSDSIELMRRLKVVFSAI